MICWNTFSFIVRLSYEHFYHIWKLLSHAGCGCLVMLALVTSVVNTHTLSTFVYLHNKTLLCYALSVGIFPTLLAKDKARFFYLSVWLLLVEKKMFGAFGSLLGYNMGTQNESKLEI